jgi:AAA domain, putative AbiEii toxin, Type IV TA system/AAA ATPase domain
MLSAVSFKNYRCFEHFACERLGRVNLFVGTNNVGKTTVLEGIEGLTGGPMRALLGGPSRREEVLYDEERRISSGYEVDPSHLFFGHGLLPGSSFELSAHGSRRLRLRCAVVNAEARESAGPAPEAFDNADAPFAQRLALQVDVEGRAPATIPLSVYGGLRTGRPTLERADETVNFVATSKVDERRLGYLWDATVLTSEENDVIESLRVIEPALERIAFLTPETLRVGRKAVVKLRGQESRVPLGSFGEGLHRLLSLALNLVHSKGGYLLVDEIDTGLHYSIIEDVWRLVIKTAERLDIQVFASTHSFDCVNALASVYQSSPELAAHVVLHRLERGHPETTMYRADEIALAAKHGMELR